jgi:hypothetical protein
MQMHSEIALPPHLHVLSSRSPSPALSTYLHTDLKPNYNRSLAFPFPLTAEKTLPVPFETPDAPSFTFLLVLPPHCNRTVFSRISQAHLPFGVCTDDA